MLENNSQLAIPIKLVSPVDLGRTSRELQNLDDALRQASIRSSGQSVNLPKTTQVLEDLAADNKLSLLKDEDRTKLIAQIKHFANNYPRVHISFAVEPTPVFVEKMIIWLRRNVHPQVLLDVGLQPSIAVGCVVRTDNKIFDLSLREELKRKRDYLLKRIGEET